MDKTCVEAALIFIIICLGIGELWLIFFINFYIFFVFKNIKFKIIVICLWPSRFVLLIVLKFIYRDLYQDIEHCIKNHCLGG